MRRICMLLATFCILSCEAYGDGYQVVVVEGDNALVPAPDWASYRKAALEAGGGTGIFVVEGDLLFTSERSLRYYYDKLQEDVDKLAVYQHTGPGNDEPYFHGTDAFHIKYCVSDNFGGDKAATVADVAAATRDWQDVINVRFEYVPSEDDSCAADNPNVDFSVMHFNQPWGPAGCASNKMIWEIWGEAMNDLCLGVGTLGLQARTVITGLAFPEHEVTVRGLLRHEIGHILGFRHEHAYANNQGGCIEPEVDTQRMVQGRRLTDYDQVSVMHYKQCDGVAGGDYEISHNDVVGAQRLYGMPAAWYVAIL